MYPYSSPAWNPGAEILSRADIQSAKALLVKPRLPSIDILLEGMSISDESHDSRDSSNLSAFTTMWSQDNQELISYAHALDERVLDSITKLQRLSSYLDFDSINFGPESQQFWLSE